MKINTKAVAMLSILLFGSELQGQTARQLLQNTVTAHLGSNAVTDVVASGTLQDESGASEPFTVYAKESQKFRYEKGPASRRRVSIANAGNVWNGAASNLRKAQDHTLTRRATVFPFFDLVWEMNNPRLQMTYKGVVTLGEHQAYQVSLRLPDQTPVEQRFLRRPISESVDLFIDSTTFLVLRSLRFEMAENNMDLSVPSVMDFLDYRSVAGVQIPFRIVNTLGTTAVGIRQSTFTIDNAIVNGGISDSMFQPQ